MGVGLAHDQVGAQGVALAAQKAHHDARRDAGDTHQEGETAGVVLAKALAGLEQEFIDRVIPEPGGPEAIVKGLLVKMAEPRLDDRRRTRGPRSPLRNQGPHPRRDIGGEGKPGGSLGLRQIPGIQGWRRGQPIDPGLLDRLGRQQLEVVGEVGVLARGSQRQVEREEPALAARFQGDFITDGITGTRRRHRRQAGELVVPGGLPAAAVGIPGHGATPIKPLGLGYGAFEANTKGEGAVKHQLTHRAGFKPVIDARAGLVLGGEKGPERSVQAGEEDEEDQGQRQSLQA